MKCRYATGVAALSLCLGTAAAQAQYYSYLPEGAGPTFRLGVGPSLFQDGQITQFSTPGVAPTGPVPSKVDYDTGLAFDAALGWAFNQYAALDFETGFIGAKINNVPGYLSDNSRIYNVPFLVNFTLSCPIPHTNIIPYVGAALAGPMWFLIRTIFRTVAASMAWSAVKMTWCLPGRCLPACVLP